MSVVVRYGPLVALCLFLSSIPGRAQEADDLRLDSDGTDDTAAIYDDLPPPPPPPRLRVPDREPPARRRRETTDPFAPQGIHTGAFMLYPQLEIGTMATSNAGGSSSDPEADVALRLKPALRIESNWSRHQFTATGSAEMLRYLDHEELAGNAATVDANLRLDVRESLQANLDFGYNLTSSSSSDSEVPDSATSSRIDHGLRAGVALARTGGLIEGRIRAGLARQIYGDVELSGGGTEDNSDRNYTEFDLSIRGTFNNGAQIRPFVEARYAPRVHDDREDRNGLKRNSHGYAVSAGLQLADNPVWTGEIAATYLIRDYEDEDLGLKSAPGLSANLKWQPTELTTVDATASVALNETSSADEAARTSWDFSALMTHALRENIDIYGGATLDFEEADGGYDRTTGVRTGLIWRANPYFAWSLGYEGSRFTGASSDDYNEHRLLAGIILQR